MGRPKGSGNKKNDELQAIAARVGVNIFEVLCLVAKGDAIALGEMPSLDQRIQAASAAAKYLYTPRKAVEISNEDAKGFKIVIEDFVSKVSK